MTDPSDADPFGAGGSDAGPADAGRADAGRADAGRTGASTPGLTPAEVAATGAWIASVQLPTGMIPWFPGGHADAWNHTEAAIALLVAGMVPEADAAFAWLRSSQQPDGSWCLYHLADGVEEPRRDPNVAAYVATGVWWHWLTTGDRGFLEAMWPTVDAAIGFVLRLQAPGGEFLWSMDVDGQLGRFALLTASSSILHSLRAAISLAGVLGHDRPEWEMAAARVGQVIAHRPEAFEPKERWAMDWYYPVLSGALTPMAARQRLDAGWDQFVMADVGIRCVSDQPWVTAAETAECVMALDAADERSRAIDLLAWTRHLREDDGSYWTGCVHPRCIRYPGGERSTYSAAAVVMASHVLFSPAVTAAMFRLPPVQPVEANSTDAAARWPDRMHAGSPDPR